MEQLFDQRRYLIPFRSSLLPQIFTDTLVIGGGVAGLSAARSASTHGEVIVVSKAELSLSSTAWAQGGIAAVMRDGDTVESHIQDTLEAGAGLCEEAAVRHIVGHAAERMGELLSLGLKLDRNTEGELVVGREGGHSAARIYHAHGDATGRELQRCLTSCVRGLSNVRVFEHCFTLDLITASQEPGSTVLGAITYHARYGLQMIWARSTILATGGAGMVYRETTNPSVATGDGLAMAYRAGATLSDMAFMQFHPTTLYIPGAARFLITEAVRGEGAYLLDAAGGRFMLDVHPLAELAPRDVVSHAIVRQISKQGGRHVWLDCRHIEGFEARFPGISKLLAQFDLDASADLIPVHPAAHYMVGGVRTDLVGRTDVPGLFAVGEVACTGLHGANRLASNSLLEGLVIGHDAGHAAANGFAAGADAQRRAAPVPVVSDVRPASTGELDLADVRSSLRSAMWKNAGIVRVGGKLDDAIQMLEFWGRYTLDKIFDDPEGWETQNMLLVGWLMARSASWREESRGCHARSDHANSEAAFLVHDCWKRTQGHPVTTAISSPVHGGV
jgi:L-aspartate oxidase